MTGPPPPPETALMLMREVVEDPDSPPGLVALAMLGVPGQNILLPADGDTSRHLALIVVAVEMGVMPVPDWVLLVADTVSWVHEGPEEEAIAAIQGSPLEAFERGDPAASESLLAICLAPDGPGYEVTQDYRRTEEGVEWGEVKRMDRAHSEGDIPDLLQAVLMARPT